LPFGDNEVRSYFQKIGRIVFAHAERELVSLTDRFMAEAKRHASDLIQTPLLLSLIIYLFNSTNRIPDNRLEIYQQCAKMLFVEWDRDRAIDPELVQQHRLMQLLPVLAGEIYTDPELASSVPISWLKHRVASFF